MNCKIALIILINILYVLPSPYLNHMITKRAKLCGSKLQTALSMLCDDGYASPHKKSIAEILNDEDEGEYTNLIENDIDYPFLTKEFAKSLVPLRTRRAGIVQECCYKSCSLKELRSYCAK